MEEIRELQKHLLQIPYMVASTQVTSVPVLNKLKTVSDYQFIKSKADYSASQIITHLRMISDYFNLEETPAKIIPSIETPEQRIKRLRSVVLEKIKEIGTKRSWIGRRFFVAAVVFLAENPGAPLSKIVYPAIAKEYYMNSKRWKSVESSVRRSIDEMWGNTPPERLKEFYADYVEGKTPTGAELIQYLADEVTIEQGRQDYKKYYTS